MHQKRQREEEEGSNGQEANHKFVHNILFVFYIGNTQIISFAN